MENLKYKLIVSDFDGTLAATDGNVPKENIDAIKRYVAAGGTFVISTGRMFGSIQKQLENLEYGIGKKELPVVSFQGALITDVMSGKALHCVPLSREIAKRAIRFCKERGIYCHFYSFQNFYVEAVTELTNIYAKYTKAEEFCVVAGDLIQYLDCHPDLAVSKILIIDDKEKIAGIQDSINLYFNGEADFVRSSDCLTECVDKNAGKGSALLWISKHYSIPVKSILAVGDSGNDASMLKAAGLGVAMGNADESLKKIAGFITEHCDSAGLAKVIDKVISGDI